MFKSVKARFIIFSMIFIILSVGIPSFFFLSQYKENFRQRSEIMLKTTSSVIYNCIKYSMLSDEKDVDKIVARYTANPHIEQIIFFDENGIITHASNKEQVSQSVFDILTNINDTIIKETPYIEQDLSEGKVSITDKIPNEPLCQKCHGNKEFIGYLNIESKMTKAESYFYTGSVHIFFLAMAIVLIIFLGFFFLFNRYINRPLYRIISAMDDIEEGDLKTRLPREEDNEFGIVFRHFNRMTETLEQNRDQIDNLHFKQLQRADKLVTLGELAAEMAHEINNPIGVIMSRAEFLSMEAEEDVSLQKHREDFDVIQRQVSRISTITGSILKYGKKLPRNYSETDLSLSIEESLKMLKPRIRKKRVSVSTNFQIERPIILGDQPQMQQVFINLINNALDALEEDGKLGLAIAGNEDARINVIVKDNGKGMDEQQMEKIFTPFYTTKSADKGTGLGLYIVQKIVQNHNGSIDCISRPGVGTTFTLTFSIYEEKE